VVAKSFSLVKDSLKSFACKNNNRLERARQSTDAPTLQIAHSESLEVSRLKKAGIRAQDR
jgi:hypothetical protein